MMDFIPLIYPMILLGQNNQIDYFLEIYVDYNAAYAASMYGLYTINVVDPFNPIVMDQFENSGWVRIVRLSGDYAWIRAGGEFFSMDISDPLNPNIIGSLSGGLLAEDFCIQGNYAYASGSGDLKIINIWSPTYPHVQGQITFSTNYSAGITVSGDYVYACAEIDGLFIIDISNPSYPWEVADIGGFDVAYDVVVEGNYAYVADLFYGFKIFDVTDPTNPQYCGYYYGIRIVDVSNPYLPVVAGMLDLEGDTYDLALRGDYIYVAIENSGVQVVDISDPYNPSFVAEFRTPGISQCIEVNADSMIYLADRYSLMILKHASTTSIDEYDIAKPGHFVLFNNYPNPFNSSTTIVYDLPNRADIKVEIFDMLGRKLETLSSGYFNAGRHKMIWNADGYPSGVYFYKIESEGYSKIKRCLLLK
jgi:hypothetical protein